jgi:hypothetical protein
MMRTRSFENGIYIAFTHPMQSLITGPTGEVITNNGNVNSDFTITEIDIEHADINLNRHIADRRLDIYS